MKKILKKVLLLCMAALLVIASTACSSDSTGSGGSTDAGGKVKLTFLTWDKAQTPGMEAMAADYVKDNPNVSIEVQTTGWDEYWTKLEAAATGNSLPDIFWIHTNELLKYTDAGILADVTSLYNDVEEDYYNKHFSQVSIDNASGSDGKIYGVPKDKDTIGLVYNKELFDKAGVSYPDENWTWDDMVAASDKIYKETQVSGYAAYCDDQLGYWNFVYQNGGFILDEAKTKAGFTDPATKGAMDFYVGLQNNDWSLKQTFFAETDPGAAFFSGMCSMYFEGNWSLKSKLDDFPEMVGKWDVAVLPKAPNPVKGDGRASISNGLSYVTGAKGKNLEASLAFLKYLGSEDAMKIQGESGAAIPAYNGTEETFLKAFESYDYKIAVDKYFDMFEYGVQSINNASRPEWKSKVNDELLKVYSGEQSLDEALEKCQTIVDEASAK